MSSENTVSRIQRLLQKPQLYKVTYSTFTYSKGIEVIAGTSFKNDKNRSRDLRSTEILRSVEWLFRTDVSGPVGWPETSVRNCHSTLRKIQEDLICHLHRGRSLKSRNNRGSVAKKAKFNTKRRPIVNLKIQF